jgi:hypothetical protein
MSRSPYRVTTDGFNFENSWVLDDVEKQRMHQIFSDALPAVEAVASPVIAVIAGPVIAAEAGIAGPFFPIILYYEVKAINDAAVKAIDGAIATGRYGLCGGMTFASLDYWLQRWVVQQGGGVNDQPTRATPEGAILRDFIWSRLIDSLNANAPTFLSWMAILQIPFLGGAQWLRDRSAEQFQLIKSRIDGIRQPVPIGLIGTTLNPMDNHQVLCSGYEDAGNGTGTLYLYDNNRPGVESRIDFDMRSSNLGTTRDDTFQSDRGPLRGFFVTSYTPAIPPPAIVLTGSLMVAGCVQQGNAVQATWAISNVGYQKSAAVQLEVVSSLGEVGRELTPAAIDYQGSRNVAVPISFGLPGARRLAVAASMEIPNDAPVVKLIPPANPSISATANLNVLPTLGLKVILPPPPASVTPGCGVVATAGVRLPFEVATNVGLQPETWQWSVVGASGHNLDGPVAEVDMPLASGSQVTVSVVVTFSGGCSSSGSLTVTTISAELAALATKLCELRRSEYRLPPYLPTGPDPEVRAHLLEDLEKIGIESRQLQESVRSALQEFRSRR